jgi:hypothetical protein
MSSEPLELCEHDYLPLAECTFQHWGEREGEPFSHLRPLTPDAAERVWRRTSAMAAQEWAACEAGGGGDVGGIAGRSAMLDLRVEESWTEATVRQWLLEQVADREQPIVVCYQPAIAVRVPWGVLCDHWLLLFWTGGCAWPLNEAWVMVHDGDRFAVGRRR